MLFLFLIPLVVFVVLLIHTIRQLNDSKKRYKEFLEDTDPEKKGKDSKKL